MTHACSWSQCSVEEAVLKCRHPWMRDALLIWLQRHGHDVSYLQPLAQLQTGSSSLLTDVTTLDPLNQQRVPEQIAAPT